MILEYDVNHQLRLIPRNFEAHHRLVEKLKENLNTVDVIQKVNNLGELAVYLRIAGSLSSAEECIKKSLTLIDKHNLGEKKRNSA